MVITSNEQLVLENPIHQIKLRMGNPFFLSQYPINRALGVITCRGVHTHAPQSQLKDTQARLYVEHLIFIARVLLSAVQNNLDKMRQLLRVKDSTADVIPFPLVFSRQGPGNYSFLHLGNVFGDRAPYVRIPD
jgi:hypothetical protein